MTRHEIESALDSGKLEVQVSNGNWWRARRNGKTRLWKTRPDDYIIPIKAGLRVTGHIDPATTCIRIIS